MHCEIFLNRIVHSFSLVLCVCSKQIEENKKKNKQAALKAQMDLEEARKAASKTVEQQNNNASMHDQEGANQYMNESSALNTRPKPK